MCSDPLCRAGLSANALFWEVQIYSPTWVLSPFSTEGKRNTTGEKSEFQA